MNIPSIIKSDRLINGATTATDTNNKSQQKSKLKSSDIGYVTSKGYYFVKSKEGELNFYDLGVSTHTDKVAAVTLLQDCLKNGNCTRPGCVRPECRPWGHHYDTM